MGIPHNETEVEGARAVPVVVAVVGLLWHIGPHYGWAEAAALAWPCADVRIVDACRLELIYPLSRQVSSAGNCNLGRAPTNYSMRFLTSEIRTTFLLHTTDSEQAPER